MIQQTYQQPNFHMKNLQEDSQSEQNCKNEIPNKKIKQKENTYIQYDHGFANRKRRDIKIEKDQLTLIFSELISFVNTKVNVIENQTQKSQNNPNSFLSLKSKKSFKQKNDERQNIPNQIIDIPNPLGKSSLKQQSKLKIIQNIEESKQTVLSDYNKIMQYKIHENQFDLQKIKRISQQNTNLFNIFQTYSFSINPIYFQTTN